MLVYNEVANSLACGESSVGAGNEVSRIICRSLGERRALAQTISSQGYQILLKEYVLKRTAGDVEYLIHFRGSFL